MPASPISSLVAADAAGGLGCESGRALVPCRPEPYGPLASVGIRRPGPVPQVLSHWWVIVPRGDVAGHTDEFIDLGDTSSSVWKRPISMGRSLQFEISVLSQFQYKHPVGLVNPPDKNAT